MKRVIFCGARDYRRGDSVVNALMKFDPSSTVIVNGGSKGGDALVRENARQMGFRVETYYANSKRDGKDALSVRNRRMSDLKGVEYVIVLGMDKAVESMIETANDAGIPVVEVDD